MLTRYARQTGIVNPNDLSLPIHVLGAGGIGSWTVLSLAKMGCDNITVYDADKVENHNVASQYFSEEQIDMDKVEALKESVFEQTGIEIVPVKLIRTEELIKNSLVVMAIDSMKERIRLGEIYKNSDNYIIDGRMGGLVLEIHRAPAYKYLETTVPPEDVDTDACTEKAISFNCLVIAGLICNYVREFATNRDEGPTDEIIYCFNSKTLLKRTRE